MDDGELKMEKSGKMRCAEILRRNLIVLLTLLGVGVGFLVGFLVSPKNPSQSALMWMGMPGELYIRMLKSVIVPLIVSCVIVGTASLDPRSNGKISVVCLIYILITNLIPSFLGAILCIIVEPGRGLGDDLNYDAVDRDLMETEDIFADLLRNIVPDNLIAATFRQSQTKYNYKKVNVTNEFGNGTIEVKQISSKYVGTAGSTDIIGLIVASAVFGLGTTAMGEIGLPFLHFFKATSEIILNIMRVLIWATPIGVASLMAETIAATDDLGEAFRKLGIYAGVVLGALAIITLIVIPLVFLIIVRRNPYKFLVTLLQPLLIVFVTASTMVALPASYHSLEAKNGVDKRVSRFVAPVSAALAKGGSGLYISASCIFIIQLVNMEVTVANATIVIVLTSVSTLAIPSIPSASLITILIILTALNIPGEAAALLFALEFFLDRARTICNLVIQLSGVMITESICKSSLALTPEEEGPLPYKMHEEPLTTKHPLTDLEVDVRL